MTEPGGTDTGGERGSARALMLGRWRASLLRTCSSEQRPARATARQFAGQTAGQSNLLWWYDLLNLTPKVIPRQSPLSSHACPHLLSSVSQRARGVRRSVGKQGARVGHAITMQHLSRVYLCEYMCMQLSREERLWRGGGGGVLSPCLCGWFLHRCGFLQKSTYWLMTVSHWGRKWDDNTCVTPPPSLSQSCNDLSSAAQVCASVWSIAPPPPTVSFPINPLLVAGVY